MNGQNIEELLAEVRSLRREVAAERDERVAERVAEQKVREDDREEIKPVLDAYNAGKIVCRIFIVIGGIVAFLTSTALAAFNFLGHK